MATYKGKTVTVRGDVTQDHKMFDRNTPKVLIQREDGSEEAVPKSEISN